jgi:site-specific recombinase XerD
MPVDDLTLKEKIDKYLIYIEFEKKYSPLTIRNYSHYLNRFSNFSKNINIESINKFKDNLISQKLTKKTVGYHLIALRSILKWLNQNGQSEMSSDQIEIPKAEANKLIFLTGSEVEKLFRSPNINTKIGVRDRAILELFYATGLRISELTTLDISSLNEGKNEIRINKKTIFLSTRAIDWIKKYLLTRTDKNIALFVSDKGKVTRLTPRSIERMLKKYTKIVGLPNNITPKTLRHSFATDLLMAGAEVQSVQKMLGHKNISTTQIYTHVTNKQLHDIHEQFHGREYEK